MGFLKKLFSRQKEEFDMFRPEDHEGLLNEELQEAIENVTADNSAANRRRVFELLLETTYCLPSAGSGDGSAQITATQNEEGEMVLAAFTDPPALRRWVNNPKSMLVMPAAQLFEVAINNDFAEILINPAGPVGGKLPRSEFISLSQGIIPD